MVALWNAWVMVMSVQHANLPIHHHPYPISNGLQWVVIPILRMLPTMVLMMMIWDSFCRHHHLVPAPIAPSSESSIHVRHLPSTHFVHRAFHCVLADSVRSLLPCRMPNDALWMLRPTLFLVCAHTRVVAHRRWNTPLPSDPDCVPRRERSMRLGRYRQQRLPR